MNPWIYWPEQCQYCLNSEGCKYIEKAQNYISILTNINDTGIYGSLSWWCDYFMCDKEKYYKEYPGECEG